MSNITPPGQEGVYPGADKPAVMTSWPNFIGAALGVALFLLPEIPYAGATYVWILGLWDIPEMTVSGIEVHWLICGLFGVLLFLTSAHHDKVTFDPDKERIYKTDRLFWFPVWSRSWHFGKVRYIDLDVRGSGNLPERAHRYDFSGGHFANPFEAERYFFYDRLAFLPRSWAPYKLYAFMQDRQRVLVTSGHNQEKIADKGILLARMTKTRLG